MNDLKTMIVLLFLCQDFKDTLSSYSCPAKCEKFKNIYDSDIDHDNPKPNICETLIIFDFSKNVTPKIIFDISIKNFLKYILQFCNSFKYAIMDDNLNTDCESSIDCKIEINECKISNGFQIIVESMNYKNVTSSYSNELYDQNAQHNNNYLKFLKAIMSQFCSCRDNSLLLLTNRIIPLNPDSEFEEMIKTFCIKITVILLGRNESNAGEILENEYKKIPNASGLSIANFDCLSYLFYCILPCSNNKQLCMKVDVDDCQELITVPNDNPEKTLHAWYVYDLSDFLNETEGSTFGRIELAIKTGLQTYINANNIRNIRIRVVTNNTFISKSLVDISSLYSMKPDFIHKLGGVFDDSNSLNDRLNLIPWSDTLTQSRIGILSIIILASYATPNFIAVKGAKNLQGWMYLDDLRAYDYYTKHLSYDANFHLSIIDSQYIPIKPFEYDNPFPTLPPIPDETTENDIITKLNNDEKTSVTTIAEFNTTDTSPGIVTSTFVYITGTSHKTLTIILCASVAVSLIIGVIGIFVYRRKRKQRESFVEQLQAALKRDLMKRQFGMFLSKKDKFELTWDQLIIKDELSAGQHEQIFRAVFIGDHKLLPYQSNIEAVVKMPHKNASSRNKENFLNEIRVMKELNEESINIIKMFGCITSGDQPCVVLEFCPNLDLLTFIKKKKFNLKVAKDKENHTKKEFFIFVWQISHALQFMASKFIIHRNLTGENILIDAVNNAKVSDFGFSITENSLENIIPITVKDNWLAIESIKNQKFSLKTDIWTFGNLLFEIYSFGEKPYAGLDAVTELLPFLENGNRLQKPSFCSDEMFNIMENCWKEDPCERPTPKELIKNFGKFLEQTTEGYGYLDLIPFTNGRIDNILQRQFSSFENPPENSIVKV